MAFGDAIRIKTRREIDAMRSAARHVAEVLLELRELARPGVTTAELDQHARRSIQKRGVTSSFLGYGPHGLPPYPAVVCVSVNDEIVHGIPGPRELEEGDVVSVDFGVSENGYHGDSAFTLAIGHVSPEAEKLIEITRAALDRGIEQMTPGNRLSATSATPCSSAPRRRASRSCASSSVTASAARCTSRRRSRTTGPPGAVRA
jgi:methionyl aminopeptidase